MISLERSHVVEVVGAYYLDALSAEENREVQLHLDGCELCRAAAQEIIEAVAALSWVDEEGQRALVEDFGALHRSGPPTKAFENFSPEPAVSWIDDVVVESKSIRMAATSEAPADEVRRNDRARGLSWHPPRRGNRTGSAAVTGTLLLAAIVVMALSATVLLRGVSDATARVATAEAAGTARGIEVSVLAAEKFDGLLMQCRVSGMRPGASYLLLVVTADGRSRPLIRWTATDTERQFTNRIDERLSNVVAVLMAQPATGTRVSLPLLGRTG